MIEPEFRMVRYQVYRRPTGEPTCCANLASSERCYYFTVNVIGMPGCFLLGRLETSEGNGFGWSVPHKDCPIWKGEKAKQGLSPEENP